MSGQRIRAIRDPSARFADGTGIVLNLDSRLLALFGSPEPGQIESEKGDKADVKDEIQAERPVSAALSPSV
jgi:hypothetical protein